MARSGKQRGKLLVTLVFTSHLLRPEAEQGLEIDLLEEETLDNFVLSNTSFSSMSFMSPMMSVSRTFPLSEIAERFFTQAALSWTGADPRAFSRDRPTMNTEFQTLSCSTFSLATSRGTRSNGLHTSVTLQADRLLLVVLLPQCL